MEGGPFRVRGEMHVGLLLVIVLRQIDEFLAFDNPRTFHVEEQQAFVGCSAFTHEAAANLRVT